jgi:hypothetical protein
VKRVRWIAGFIALTFFFSSQAGFASFQGIPDFTNERVVPIMSNANDLSAGGSGFLYSSRIVLTSAHTAFNFNSNGQRQDFRPDLAVGMPNTDIKKISQGVRVIKRFSAPGYLANDNPDLNDFAILILERDLIPVKPVQLLTPEIYRELLEKRSEVKLHGYGNTEDLCSPGDVLPCRSDKFKASDVPRTITATLRPSSDFPDLVGYAVPQRLTDQLLFFTPGKSSMCGGDSGGSLTSTYNGEILYLSNIGTADRIYACGQGRMFDGRGGINYSQPIYKYLDLIKEAEAFVAEQMRKEQPKVAVKKATITCVKGKAKKKVTALKPSCPSGFKKK